MTLHLTPTILQAAYDFLNHTLPFRRWNLPDGEDVKFLVVRDARLRAWYRPDPHRIAVSSACIGRPNALMEAMAHEMVHLYERHAGIYREDVEHSLTFKRLAAQVCKVHEFDLKLF